MIKLGNRIRELRKAKGLTQEQMASAFSVSPQAVSKWENGGGYPDMGLIPIIANYFDVTLDDLFDFDVNKKSEEIEDILRKVGPYFWNDFDRAEQIFLDGIKKYPGSEKLKTELLSLYECHVRTLDRQDLMDRFEELARRLTLELTDVFAVCSAKNSLISLYMMQDKYAHAKAVADTLPYMYPYILNDRMRCASYLLRGEDRLKEAKVWKVIEEQELFVACVLEGTGYFEIGDYENALKSFTEACDVIELFMIPGKNPAQAHSIYGTHTNHMCYYVAIAGCYKKLGKTAECESTVNKIYGMLHEGLLVEPEAEEDDRRAIGKEMRKYDLAEYENFDKKA